MIRELEQNQGAYWKFSAGAPTNPIPPNVAAGYTSLVLFDDFLSTSTIDMANSKGPGFNWYLANWFTGGTVSTNANTISVANSVLTIGGQGTGNWPYIVSAFDTGVTDAYTGTVYGGRGYYFEVKMKFDPSLYTAGATTTGAPNVYGMSIEHIADNGAVSLGKWPGQANGYAHFMEVDFFEPLTNSATTYNASTHDWSGTWTGSTWSLNVVNGGNNIVSTGPVNFNQFHLYGFLWVPQNGATPGRLQRYFDGMLVQTLYFLGPPGTPPPPNTAGSYTPTTTGAAAATYSVIDINNLALLIGGGHDWPIQVDWIKVWQ